MLNDITNFLGYIAETTLNLEIPVAQYTISFRAMFIGGMMIYWLGLYLRSKGMLNIGISHEDYRDHSERLIRK